MFLSMNSAAQAKNSTGGISLTATVQLLKSQQQDLLDIICYHPIHKGIGIFTLIEVMTFKLP